MSGELGRCFETRLFLGMIYPAAPPVDSGDLAASGGEDEMPSIAGNVCPKIVTIQGEDPRG